MAHFIDPPLEANWICVVDSVARRTVNVEQKMASITIDRCAFGTLLINGTPYGDDLMIRPDGTIISPWRRRRGHQLSMDDLEELIDASPDVIVMGTGMNGGVVPDSGLKDQLAHLTIEFIPEPNDRAVRIFNDLVQKKRVGAGFHLTC